MSIAAQIDDLNKYIASRKSDIEDLLRKYGNGVRPSFVGDDISHHHMAIESAERDIAELQRAGGK